MYAPSNLARYGAVAVNTASPGRILVMLYDALARFLREAAEGMDAKDRARGAQKVNAAYNILDELLNTLDRSQNPELCQTLEGLYGFCLRRLVDANVKQDAALVREVATLLQPVREAFQAAVTKSEAHASAPPSVRRAG